MTKQTFDPYCSLSLPDMLDQAKISLVWNPLWGKIKGTPLETDIPIWMVDFAHKYLKRHTEQESNTRAHHAQLVERLRGGEGEAFERWYANNDLFFTRNSITKDLYNAWQAAINRIIEIIEEV